MELIFFHAEASFGGLRIGRACERSMSGAGRKSSGFAIGAVLLLVLAVGSWSPLAQRNAVTNYLFRMLVVPVQASKASTLTADSPAVGSWTVTQLPPPPLASSSGAEIGPQRAENRMHGSGYFAAHAPKVLPLCSFTYFSTLFKSDVNKTRQQTKIWQTWRLSR